MRTLYYEEQEGSIYKEYKKILKILLKNMHKICNKPVDQIKTKSSPNDKAVSERMSD